MKVVDKCIEIKLNDNKLNTIYFGVMPPSEIFPMEL